MSAQPVLISNGDEAAPGFEEERRCRNCGAVLYLSPRTAGIVDAGAPLFCKTKCDKVARTFYEEDDDDES